MPTLLQINVTSNWGSTGKIVEQIGSMAIAHGWNSYVAYGRVNTPSENKLIKVGSLFDVYEHYVENLFLDNEGLASRKATRRFINTINAIQPDVVHLHNIHDHFVNYKILLNYLASKNIPVVWTQHDQWITTGHCMYSINGCDRWQIECFDCPMSRWFSCDQSRRNFLLKKNLCAQITSLTIVPVSNWLAKNIRLSHLKERPIEVIHNGIDLNVFTPQVSDIKLRYNLDADKKIVLGVAALWDERKGLKDFYKLVKLLPKEEYIIVIVGRLIEKQPNTIEGCQIRFIDRTQTSLDLAQLYSAASVFVNPTYQDNYPTTNLEAMACGTPVITYDTGGSPESIDENTGVVLSQGDIIGLKESVVKLSSGNYQEACVNKAKREFDNKKCFQKYLDLYQKLLK